MLNLVTFTTIIASVLSQEILGVNYTFNEDFDIYFDNKTCQNSRKWHLVEYQTLKIFYSNAQSYKGIIATNNSCVSSFAIVFLPNSVLEVNVYVHLTSLKSVLSATVFDESETPIVTYGYNRSSENYTPGWNTLQIAVNKSITGYLNLRGRIEGKDIIIVDSFSYVINKSENYDDTEVLWNSSKIDKSESLLLENLQLPNDIIDEFWNGDEESDGSGDNNESDGSGDNNDNEPDGSGDNNESEGSGDNNDDINSTTPSDIIDRPDTPTPFKFWNPWTITLVTVGSFVIISIMVVIAYYIGKKRGQKDNAAVIESFEPPRILRIPRVNRIYSGFPSYRYR